MTQMAWSASDGHLCYLCFFTIANNWVLMSHLNSLRSLSMSTRKETKRSLRNQLFLTERRCHTIYAPKIIGLHQRRQLTASTEHCVPWSVLSWAPELSNLPKDGKSSWSHQQVLLIPQRGSGGRLGGNPSSWLPGAKQGTRATGSQGWGFQGMVRSLWRGKSSTSEVSVEAETWLWVL